MRISLIVLPLIACPALLFPQTPGEDMSPKSIVKIVRVHGDARNIANLAGSGSGTHFEVSEALRAIVVRGRPTDVANVEKTIQELDALSPSAASSAGKNVELTTYVIGGSMQPIAGTQEATGESLSPVIKQLRAIFPYTHYQVLSTMIMRSSQNGKASSQGMMRLQPLPDVSQPSSYVISYDSAKVSDDASASIHLSNFRFSAKVPYVSGSLRGNNSTYTTTQFQMMDVGIDTDVDLREGQKVIVGKANVAESDTCFFLLLVAKLVP
ncbi:MAG: hypothetical protein M3Y72_00055 [Acidobacteriota bacterium]|nr:hypothetical protein [Acidobacteriota bacterium]